MFLNIVLKLRCMGIIASFYEYCIYPISKDYTHFNINTFLCQELTWFNIDLLWDATTDEDFLLLCLLLLLLSSPSSKTLFPVPGAFEPWLAIDAWCGGRKFWSLEHTTFRCSLSLSCKALLEHMYQWKQSSSQIYLQINERKHKIILSEPFISYYRYLIALSLDI